MKQAFYRRLVVCAFALCFSTSSLGSGLDAFVLAVQHFDSDHEKGVEYISEEVEFMRQILWEARKSVPEVAGLHVRVDDSMWSNFGPSMYRSLRVKPPARFAGKRGEAEAALREISESIGLGCRHEEQTNKTYRSNRHTSFNRQVRSDLLRDCDDEHESRLCENTRVIDWLCSMGVESATFSEHRYKTISSAELFLRFKNLSDLEFRAKQLIASSIYSEVFGDFELVPFGGTLIGDGTTVRAIPVVGLDGFEGARVEFSVGWGDCEAGCIARHYWVFEYRADGERIGKDWPLSGGLVEEHGDQLYESARQRLSRAELVR